jgi:hypothetical protein
LRLLAGVYGTEEQPRHDGVGDGADAFRNHHRYQHALADYKPGLFDGFLVNRDGQGMLLMKRQGADDSGRTGFIEYNNYRHEMIEEARTQRIVATIKASYTMGRANRCVVC